MDKERQRILRAHYARLLKKAVAWSGLAAMTIVLLPTYTASAAQLTSRKATVGSSAGGATTTYTLNFTAGSTGNVGSIKFEICDSPLNTTACAASAVSGTNSNGASLAGGGLTAAFAGTNWVTGTWTKGTAGNAPTGPGTTGTSVKYARTASSVTAGDAATVTVTNVVNPTGNNQQYYLRITTYTDTGYATPADFGAVALSTAQQVAVSANVQESLAFCVYTLANCGAGGSTVNLGTGTDNVLSASTPSGGISKMSIDTNATTGYVITYVTTSPGGTGGSTCAGSLSSTNDCITDAGGSAVGFTAGTARFGINLMDNTLATFDIGAAISGSGTGAVTAPYATIDNYAFQGGSTPRQVASAAGPTVSNIYTVSYVAQAGSTTKPGAYSATFTWVATGNF